MNLLIILIIIANIAVFYLLYKEKLDREDLGSSYLYTIIRKDYKRLITSGFTHAGIIHLMINMYSLYNVGNLIIRMFGTVQFLLIYFGSMVFGGLAALYLRHNNHDDYTMSIGASGGIFGLFGVYLMLIMKYYGPTYILSPVINMLIITFIPGVDKYSHICCLAVGVVLGFVLLTI